MKAPLAAKTTEITIINRREIEPLQYKASLAMESYRKAIGCGTWVRDRTGYAVTTPGFHKPSPFCDVCRACYPDSAKVWGKNENPCIEIHIEAQTRGKLAGSYIYTCDIGFSYWTSPLYAGDLYAGSLIAGQVLAVPREEAVGQFCCRCKGVSRNEVTELFSRTPEKKHDEITAMAKLLMVCAKKLSYDPENSPPGDPSALEGPAENSGEGPWFYPRDKERTLLAALRRGDRSAAMVILDEFFDSAGKTGPRDTDSIRLMSFELAVLLSRAAGKDLNPGEDYYRCLSRLRESQSPREMRENLRHVIGQMGPRIFSFQGIRHASALRKAERFIWENYTRKISLKQIAAASGLSPSYFSTVFKEEMGQNLSSYLNRLRVDKAGTMLIETGLPLKEIAQNCGFEDQSWFSKIFKSHTGQSPAKYREQGNGRPEKDD